MQKEIQPILRKEQNIFEKNWRADMYTKRTWCLFDTRAQRWFLRPRAELSLTELSLAATGNLPVFRH